MLVLEFRLSDRSVRIALEEREGEHLAVAHSACDPYRSPAATHFHPLPIWKPARRVAAKPARIYSCLQGS